MSKIGVVGNTGYIAKALIKQLQIENFDIIKIGRSADFDVFLDLSNVESFNYNIISELDFVIFTAAISSPDVCSKEYDIAWNVNVRGTKEIISNFLKLGIRVLFLSSDAVYGKNEKNIYTEESETRPFTPYGKMKKEIEDSFKENVLFKSIRLSSVVSSTDKFTKYCIESYKNKKVIEVFHPFYRSCIVLEDVLQIFSWLIRNWNIFEPRIINACGDELISRVRIVDEINRYLNNSLNYTITIPEETFFKNRSRITQMKSLYLQSYKILSEDNFSEKIIKELRGVQL